MDYKAALKECKRVGTARASGDAYRAMCADMVAFQHGGNAQRYYAILQGTGSDEDARQMMLTWMRDRASAWKVLIGA